MAQTLLPSELKIAALSTWPVPTRLWGGVLDGDESEGRSDGGRGGRKGTWCRRMLVGISMLEMSMTGRRSTLPRHVEGDG